MPHADPEARRAYERDYRQKNNELIKARVNDWRRHRYATVPEYRERVRARVKTILQPEVHAAHQRVYKALRRGEIVRPDTCSRCGVTAYIEAAHLSYTERLDIVWLCRSCHRKEDQQNPKTPLSARGFY